MYTLTKQIEEIESNVADIWCKAMNGKTCKELVADIIEENLEKKSSFYWFLQNIEMNYHI